MQTLADLQVEANFPLLASAIVLLDRKLKTQSYSRILLSARDCYLMANLWRRMFPATPYEICYWLTSRWSRIKGSERYLDYCRGMLKGKVLIFDLVGTGESIEKLGERLGATCDYFLLQADPRKNIRAFLTGPGDIEGLNCAPHPSIIGISKDSEPIYDNPKNIDWWKYFEDIGGLAFLECCKRPDYSDFIDAEDCELRRRMRGAESKIEHADDLFKPFHQIRRNEDWQ